MARGRATFVAVVVGIAAFVAVMAYLEPQLHDCWHFRRYAQTHSFLDYARFMHLESDARLGNLIAYFVCSSTAVHVIWAPAMVLLLIGSMFAVALGRWPRAADSPSLLVVFALYLVGTSHVGVMTFYRPFATMYVHAFALLLVLVAVPYRFALGSEAPSRAWWRVPVMFAAGFVGGFTNEHTAPTALVFVVACLVVLRRRGVRWPAWMVAGLLGLLVGFLLLLFAPAQDLRYGGLATQSTIVGRIVDRGVGGNLAVLGKLLFAARWVAALVVGAAVVFAARRGSLAGARSHAITAGALVVAALLVFGTMLASPLQGYRLLFASSQLLIMAAFVALDFLGRDRAVRAGVVAVSLVIGVASAVQALRIYRTAHDEFEARMAILSSAPDHATPVVPAYSRGRGRWTYGDDLADPGLRDRLIRRYWPHLDGIEYVPYR